MQNHRNKREFALSTRKAIRGGNISWAKNTRADQVSLYTITALVRRVENPGYQVSDTAKPPLTLPPNRVALHRNPGDAGEVDGRPTMGFGT